MTPRPVKEDAPARSRLQLKIDPARQREIVGLALFALGGLVLLSLLHVTPGSVSDLTASVLQNMFGWGAFALPLCAFGGSAFLLRRGDFRPATVPWGRVFAAEILFAVLIALVHLMSPGSNGGALADSGGGGGFLGWAIGGGLAAIVGPIGAGLILLGIAAFTLPAVLGGDATRLRGWGDRLTTRIAEGNKPRSIPPKEGSAGARAPASSRARRSVSDTAPPVALARAKPLDRQEEDEEVAEDIAAAPRAPATPRPIVLKPMNGANAQGLVLTPRRRSRRRVTLPSLDLLDSANEAKYGETDANIKARLIEETLGNFGIPAKVIEINAGPTVTQFGLEPGFISRRSPDGHVRQRKISVNRIAALQHDLELALASAPIRVETPVPGRPIVGIEVPNQSVELVSLHGVLESDGFKKKKGMLKIALGRDVSGASAAADLAAMPHLLIAGATGSGKSVCINTIVACLLINHSPDTCRLILVDPKRVELTSFNNIPHLLGPVIVDMEEVVPALRWLTREMDNRFTEFARAHVRNIESYNEKMLKGPGTATMPYIVAIIDELADLMLAAPDETEKRLTRLAQMARATGIHLIIATQRPSVDVVTGLIKANFSARISFAVTSSVDSRVVLDTPGAEKLLGRGDMLYMASDSSKLHRMQGCFVSDDELARLVNFWRNNDQYETAPEAPWKALLESAKKGEDDLIEQALELVQQYDRTSISFLQRRLEVGYPRAARLMDQLEERGIVGPDEGAGKSRPVLVHAADAQEFEEESSNGRKNIHQEVECLEEPKSERKKSKKRM